MLKKKMASGQPVMGTWSIINSPVVTEIIALSGMDFMILDGEHGLFDMGSLDVCIRAAEAAGSAPLVRVPRVDHPLVQNALDMGAHGIVVPQVSDYDSVLRAVQSMKFSPEGTRGYNPFTRSGSYTGSNSQDQRKLRNDFPLSCVIIETAGAYRDLDRILEIPDLDLVYLGAYDMSLVLGCQGDINSPAVRDFLETAIPKIRRSGKSAGVMVKTREEAKRFVGLGANFLVYAVDSYVLLQAMSQGKQLLDNLNQ